LIGFAGSPWTLAAYMIEGRSSADFRLAKAFMLDQPHAMTRLVHLLGDAITSYLNTQVSAGADALMIFDSWGGMLSPRHYLRYSLEPIERIMAGLVREHVGRKVPSIVFSKGANATLERIADCGCDAVALDWTIELGEARRRIGDRVALQGNLDPTVLYARPERIREEVGYVLDSFGPGSGHVFNLGHGLQPRMDPDRVGACVAAVHELGASRAR
ncbi:MAG: uroporphyrinogen decarboxylase family protein, partial [Gammaproteobacteria bacterium]